MDKMFKYKSPGISIYEGHNNYSPSFEYVLNCVPLKNIIEIIGIEKVENCLRRMKINKIKNNINSK